MIFMTKDFKEISTAQLVSLGGGLVAGTVLAGHADKLLAIPGILLILPGFLDMRGNISGSFAARLSSGLFLGMIDPRKIGGRIIRGNLVASFFLAILISALLGLIAFGFNYVVLDVSIPKVILLPLVAGIFANALEIPLTLFATLYLYRKGHDPDNIMGPFVTSTGDLISIVALLGTSILIL